MTFALGASVAWASPSFGLAATFVADTDAGRLGHFHFYGPWEHVKHFRGPLIADSTSRTASPGAAVAINFFGTSVRLYGTRGPGGGHGVLIIDDKKYPDVDFYAPKRIVHALIFTSPVLPKGHHVLAIAAEADRRDGKHRSSYINVSGALFQ